MAFTDRRTADKAVVGKGEELAIQVEHLDDPTSLWERWSAELLGTDDGAITGEAFYSYAIGHDAERAEVRRRLELLRSRAETALAALDRLR